MNLKLNFNHSIKEIYGFAKKEILELEILKIIWIMDFPYYIRVDFIQNVWKIYQDKVDYEAKPEIIARRKLELKLEKEWILFNFYPSIYISFELVEFYRQYQIDLKEFQDMKLEELRQQIFGNLNIDYIYLNSEEREQIARMSSSSIFGF